MEKDRNTMNNFAGRGGDLVYLVCLVRRIREIRQTHAPDRLPLSYPPLAQGFHIVTGSGSA